MAKWFGNDVPGSVVLIGLMVLAVIGVIAILYAIVRVVMWLI